MFLMWILSALAYDIFLYARYSHELVGRLEPNLHEYITLGHDKDLIKPCSYTVTIPAKIHQDSSQFKPDGKIGVHRDASGWKKRYSSINTMSHVAPTVSARFIYRSTKTHDSSAKIYHGGATNAHNASTIRYGAIVRPVKRDWAVLNKDTPVNISI